jgi:hypothetical protein
VGKDLQKYRVRTRDGYRLLQQAQLSSGLFATAAPESNLQ